MSKYARWPCEECGRHRMRSERTETKTEPVRIGWPRLSTTVEKDEQGAAIGRTTAERWEHSQGTMDYSRFIFRCADCGWEKASEWSRSDFYPTPN